MLKPKQVPALIGSNLGKKGNGTPVASPSRKGDAVNVHDLAIRTMGALRKRDFGELAMNLAVIHSFDAAAQAEFNDAVAGLQFLDNSFDPQGLAELSACTLAVMTGQPHNHAH